MTKFTNELKIKIIKDYISGMQLPQISKKYNINISYLNYIIALYRVHEYDGLISYKKFTPQIFYHYRVATSILQKTYLIFFTHLCDLHAIISVILLLI